MIVYGGTLIIKVESVRLLELDMKQIKNKNVDLRVTYFFWFFICTAHYFKGGAAPPPPTQV